MKKITSMKMLFGYLTRINPLINQKLRSSQNSSIFSPSETPLHLICFKDWSADMVLEVIQSALNLKFMCADTHNSRLDVLADTKVLILQEINEPILSLAVSKAATFLGAYDVNVVDHIVWEHDYNGSIFSAMADMIFVTTTTHWCIQRFAEKSAVPVMCMRSRTHASIQALATIMTFLEEFATLRSINLAYIGPPHPILNSYLILCPMLGANIKFKCSCNVCPVSPLLLKSSKDMTESSNTRVEQCKTIEDALSGAKVIISGPTSSKKEKIKEFTLSAEGIVKSTGCNWIYFHTCPRGTEVDDKLFYHYNSRTFRAFENLQYIAAALMAAAVRKCSF